MASTNFIDKVTSFIKPIDTKLSKLVSDGIHYSGRAVSRLNETYESSICVPAGTFICKHINEKLGNTVSTLTKILPIALAFLIIANPMSITSGFLGTVLVAGLITVGAPDLFSLAGKVKLCQGASLAAGLHTAVTVVKIAVYGATGTTAIAFVGGIAFAGLFYYAANHFQHPGRPLGDEASEIKK